MYLNHLSLSNFRSFSRLELAFPREILLLVGGNAEGKTSLLESIYLLSTMTSFYAGSDRQLINFTLPETDVVVGRVVGDFTRRDSTHRIEVRLIMETNGANGSTRFRKEALVDGVRRKLSEAVGMFNAVNFMPQMARIIEESPADRRRYLDMLISQVSPRYLKHLNDYNQTLSQRNALLKQLAERGGDQGQLTVWDDVLARHASMIMYERIQTLQLFGEEARQIYLKLTNGHEDLRFDYQPAYEPLQLHNYHSGIPESVVMDRSHLSKEELESGILEALKQRRREEIARGVTTIGPHRDELRFLSNNVDLGNYGSRGQGRTALLAMKLAEVNWLHQQTGEWPVLLLDEIMSELDIQRRRDLLAALSHCEQAILTSTDLEMFDPTFVNSRPIWRADAGRIIFESTGD